MVERQSQDSNTYATAGTLDGEIEKVLSFYDDVSTDIRGDVQSSQASFENFQHAVIDSDELSVDDKIHQIDDKVKALQAIATRITNILQYVSLNTQGLRKILKKFGKHVEPTKPQPGFLALEIEHPHQPGWKLLQVSPCCDVSCCALLCRAVLCSAVLRSRNCIHAQPATAQQVQHRRKLHFQLCYNDQVLHTHPFKALLMLMLLQAVLYCDATGMRSWKACCLHQVTQFLGFGGGSVFRKTCMETWLCM